MRIPDVPVKRLRACKSVGQFARNESGASLIEVTLVLPLALALMGGIAVFGDALRAYHQADKSVRSAARYLARIPSQAAIDAWAFDRAEKLALQGSLEADSETPHLVKAWVEPGVIALAQEADAENIILRADVDYPVLIQWFDLPWTVSYSVRHQEPRIGE
jgi:Flp pilus assembly pilin Flp